MSAPTAMSLATWLVLAHIGGSRAQTLGNALCPCVEFANVGAARVGNDVVYQPTPGGPTYTYPRGYGSQFCKAHDSGTQPFCAGATPPSWCEAQWCYIDASTCNLQIGRSKFFTPTTQLYYSYETCGAQNVYVSWSGDSNASSKLLVEVNNLLAATRQQVQDSYKALSGSSATCSAVPDLLCTNSGTKHWKWGVRLDFRTAGAWMNPGASLVERNKAKCVFDAADDTFLRTAVKEGDKDGSRVGYLYMADQDSGSYLQWPDTEFCPVADYDPRLRPYYAAGATSPKDVLVVVDVSGSMAQGNPARSTLSLKAVKAILKTVTWKDFIGIVLFNDNVAATYKNVLVPATEAEKAKIEAWADNQVWAHYGTNFRAAFTESFDILKRSIDAAQTSTCQKMILFLTDGEDVNFQASDYTVIRNKATQYGTFIFTYALGSGADVTVSKNIACQNEGVFQKVEDNADLAVIMSKYYEYFVAGQHLCTASSVKFKDFISNQDLYTSCLPIYEKDSSGHPELVGVTCMDYSLVADINVLRQSSDWDDLICKISDASKQCQPLELTECHRQKIRAGISAESVCDTAVVGHSGAGTCPCMDRACEDNPDFVDEKEYFCDQWVGDRCDEATSVWGYSGQGQQILMAQCRKSCGQCGYSTAHCSTPKTCPSEMETPRCRTCFGKISGADINGNKLCCPASGDSCGGSADPGGEEEEADSTMIIIIVVVVVVVVLFGGGCIGFMMCRRKRRPTGYPAAAPPSAVAAAPPVPAKAFAEPAPAAVAAPAVATWPAAPASATSSAASAASALGKRVGAPLPPQKVPTYWDNQDIHSSFNKLIKQPAMIQDMQELITSTYKKVTTSDRGGAEMPESLTVVSVQRNENRELWQSYVEAREAIRKTRPHRCTPMKNMRGGEMKTTVCARESGLSIGNDLDTRVNEVYLWHGTSPAGMEAIMKGGFKTDFIGSSTGTMYGAGFYFAECSSKSDEYAKDDADGAYGGLHCFLLCRVVLGEALGMQVGGSKVHETVKASLASGAFNSVMGDREASVGTYRELVVYTEDVIYPEFGIVYRRS